MDAPFLAATGLCLRYGATIALDGVDLDVRGGEVHAVVGENGAGKSTLLRVLAGAAPAQAGRVARAPGARLAWVPQEAVLPADLDAAAWIFLGHELRGPLGLLRSGAMRSAAAAALRSVGCHAEPTVRLGALTASQRKQVQLARALRGAVDLLLLDEPTAALGAADALRLFAAVRALARAGAAIVYVSHRLDEVLDLADRVTVLRDGRRIATEAVGGVDLQQLVRAMVGRDVPAGARFRAGERRGLAGDAGARADAVLRLRDVSVGHVRGVSMAVRAGEIVGIAGLVGSGRSALLEGVAGLRPVRGGSVHAAAPPVFVPEDRQRKGLVATLCLRENLFLPASGWLLHVGAERRRAVEWIERLAIRSSGSEAAIGSLSGGNQQKVLLARALRHAPRLLLLDEPTAGVDVGAKAELHAAIQRLAAADTAVLLASSDLPELLALCDRIAILYRGACAGILDVPGATEEQIAALMTGTAGQAPAPPTPTAEPARAGES
jgi:ABC-type sugar transport system ATPase subunit